MNKVWTWIKDIALGLVGLSGSVAAAPAGTFDPKTTAIATGIAAVGAGVAGIAHVAQSATAPKTPEEAVADAVALSKVAQAVAPGTPVAQDAAAVQALAPVALAGIQLAAQIHAATLPAPVPTPVPVFTDVATVHYADGSSATGVNPPPVSPNGAPAVAASGPLPVSAPVLAAPAAPSAAPGA